MVAWINSKINESFETSTAKSKEDILSEARERIMDYDGFIKGEPPTITHDRIEIKRKPHSFAAFRGLGTISFSISERDSRTKIMCAIFPYNNSYPKLLLFGAGWLAVWSLPILLIFRNRNTLGIVASGWGAAILCMLYAIISNKWKLRGYAKDILRELLK